MCPISAQREENMTFDLDPELQFTLENTETAWNSQLTDLLLRNQLVPMENKNMPCERVLKDFCGL